jgi:tetratricopeptide (TPR) repeat protein
MRGLRLALAGQLFVLLVACGTQAPLPVGAETENELRVIQLPDANMASPEQLASYRSGLESIERHREIAEIGKADLYGELGKRLFADGFESSAEPCFLNAQALDPERFDWIYYLAHLYAATGQTQNAQERFEAAIKKRPDDVASWVSLGNTFLAAARPDEAIRAFEEALVRSPESASALTGMGRALLARDDYPAALEALSRALELAPQASAIHYPLAQAARGSGRTALAEEHLELRGEVEIYPYDPLMEEIRTRLGDPIVLNERGRAAFARGDFEAAVVAFRNVLEATADEAWVYVNLGSALFHHGDTNAAVEALRTAQSLAPGDPDALFGLGSIADREGGFDRAENLYRAALAADSTYIAASLRLAHLLRRSERHLEAVEHYTVAIAVEPRLAVAHLGRAMSLVKLRRWADARDALEEASRSLPDQPAFAHALARVLATAPDETVRDGIRALQVLDGLVKAGQDNTDLGESLAMALAETGEFERARQIQTQVVTLAGSSVDPTIMVTMTARLESYARNEAWREPWPDEHPLHRPPADAAPAPPRRAHRTP